MVPAEATGASIGSLVPADEEIPQPKVPWDEPEAVMAEIEAMLDDGNKIEATTENVVEDMTESTAKEDTKTADEDITETIDEIITTEVTEDITETATEDDTKTTDNDIPTEEVAAEEAANDTISSDQPDEQWFKSHEMPPKWFVLEHVRCPGDEVSHYAEYVRGSDDMWYFRLDDGAEYRPLDARELRSFLNWRAATRPMTNIMELEDDEFF